MVEDVTVGDTYSDGETEHEIVGIADGEVDVVEYDDGEEIGEYTVEIGTFRDRVA